MNAMRKYAVPIAAAVNSHGPVAGVLEVAADLVDKVSKTKDPESGRKMAGEAASILRWLQREVGRRARGGSR